MIARARAARLPYGVRQTQGRNLPWVLRPVGHEDLNEGNVALKVRLTHFGQNAAHESRRVVAVLLPAALRARHPVGVRRGELGRLRAAEDRRRQRRCGHRRGRDQADAYRLLGALADGGARGRGAAAARRVDLADAGAVAAALEKVPENRLAKAIVDNACWTLRAAVAGKPLWQLLGGQREVELCGMVTRQSRRAWPPRPPMREPPRPRALAQGRTGTGHRPAMPREVRGSAPVWSSSSTRMAATPRRGARVCARARPRGGHRREIPARFRRTPRTRPCSATAASR